MDTKREIGTFLAAQLLLLGGVGLYTNNVFGILLLNPISAVFYLVTGSLLTYFLTLQLRGLEYFSKLISVIYIIFAFISLLILFMNSAVQLNIADIYYDGLVSVTFYYLGFAKRYKRHYQLA